MKQRRLVEIAFCWLGFAGVCFAQSPPIVTLGPPLVAPVAGDGGTVTGHVYCSDTQRPARFAAVELLKAAITSSRGQGSGNQGPTYQSAGGGRTALDGSFTISGVPAGDYYVSATMTGYISPVAVARMTRSAIVGAPMTHVEANHSADVMVSIDRGAAVSGRVAYDDGTPLPGVQVRLRSMTAGTAASGSGRPPLQSGFFSLFSFGSDMGFAQTDDRGVFRIPGVPPGHYSLVATVQTESTGRGAASRGSFRVAPLLDVYAPATMRKGEARVLEIHGGETIDGVDIQVALNGLRTVQGSVTSKADGHTLNAGMASLADASDASLTRTASIGSDGTFRMEYLPPGTYTLTVHGEDRQQDAGGRRGSTKRYESATETVTVGDHDLTLDAVPVDEAKGSSN